MDNLSFLKITKTKNFSIILISIFLLVLIGIFLQRHAIVCRLLPVLGYEKLNDQLFIADDITLAEAASLQQLVNSASVRISKVYGEPESQPRIFITSDLKIDYMTSLSNYCIIPHN